MNESENQHFFPFGFYAFFTLSPLSLLTAVFSDLAVSSFFWFFGSTFYFYVPFDFSGFVFDSALSELLSFLLCSILPCLSSQIANSFL
jgi:hypothetical protein